jgi:two-component system, OmpR family, sensor histidine kinase TctE
MRTQLLVGILLPVLAFIAFNTVVVYRQALSAADTAYDRTLLASAKSIGELLDVNGQGETAQLSANLLYAALEPFEADNRSRMYYKVTGFQGEMVSGYAELPAYKGKLPDKGLYAALVDFYDDSYRGEAVRVAVLLQPVSGVNGQGMATVQVAETLELRQTLARQILIGTLWREALLLLVIAAVVVWAVQRATQPVRALSEHLNNRGENNFEPIASTLAPRELQPLITATNQVMGRMANLLAHQKRFVRDTSHQLRTPLAVLKVQVQSALRGDVEPQQALIEIEHTVQRATELANQMLALAKVEQLRQQADVPVVDWAAVVRAVALDLSPLITDHRLVFSLDAVPCEVRGFEWALRELTRNLLHNAIKNTPDGSGLRVTLAVAGELAKLVIADDGPGVSQEMRQRLFQAFSSAETATTSASNSTSGSGLGLAICHEIVVSLGGRIDLVNREQNSVVTGLDATVLLPLAHNQNQ